MLQILINLMLCLHACRDARTLHLFAVGHRLPHLCLRHPRLAGVGNQMRTVRKLLTPLL